MSGKRLLSILLCFLLTASLAACGASPVADSETPSIVATIFPLYDWTMNLLGDHGADIDVTFLTEDGVDMHNFQPTADDIIRISSCDLFIYVGGESDGWVEDVLREAVNPDMIVLNLMDALGSRAQEETILEGMQAEEDEEENAYDEHIWLSLKNAQTLCSAIAQALSSLDPDHADDYAANADGYLALLAGLNEAYQAATDSAVRNTLLFADRFPFRYLADDYALTCYAAFPGCSAETEASFETIAFLAGKLDELSLPVVLTIEGSDQRLAETVIANAAGSPQIRTLNSMQGTTAADYADGQTYLSIMEENLQILSTALN